MKNVFIRISEISKVRKMFFSITLTFNPGILAAPASKDEAGAENARSTVNRINRKRFIYFICSTFSYFFVDPFFTFDQLE